MNHRTTAGALAAIAALALTACAPGTTTPADSKPSPSKAAGLTAKQAAAELADATGVTTLGEPDDNTDGCSNKAAGKKPSPNDCSQLITTDTVSIYEYKSPKVAAHWVKTMKAQGDWRQVDRFALAWTAREQNSTSDERRTELVAALKKSVAAKD